MDLNGWKQMELVKVGLRNKSIPVNIIYAQGFKETKFNNEHLLYKIGHSIVEKAS